jgi:MFS family permease
MAAAQGALILSLVPLSMLLPVLGQLVALYAIVFTVGACGALFQPAQIALLGDIVPEAQQPRAMGVGQASLSLAMLMGPAIAPLLVLNVGVAWAFILNAASFAVSYAAIFFIRPPRAVSHADPRAERHFWRELGEGLRFFLRSRVLRTLMIAYAIAMLGGGILNALDIFFTTQNLHTPLALYGLLNTALALGLIVGAILASVFAQRIGLGRTIWIALVALGVLVLVYARLTSFVPAAVLLALLGIPLASLEVAGGPLVLRTAPRELVGRVTSLLNPIVILAGLVGTALAGYLDGAVLRGFHFTTLGVTIGPVDTIYTAAGVLVLAGGLYAWVGLRGNAKRRSSPEEARMAEIA